MTSTVGSGHFPGVNGRACVRRSARARGAARPGSPRRPARCCWAAGKIDDQRRAADAGLPRRASSDAVCGTRCLNASLRRSRDLAIDHRPRRLRREVVWATGRCRRGQHQGTALDVGPVAQTLFDQLRDRRGSAPNLRSPRRAVRRARPVCGPLSSSPSPAALEVLTVISAAARIRGSVLAAAVVAAPAVLFHQHAPARARSRARGP